MTEHTRQDLIDLLLSLDKQNRPELRKHISDSVWMKHFGSFKAFKECAGLSVPKTHKQFNNQLSKHAVSTAPTLVNYNESLNSYSDKYLRKDSTRFKTVMVISDVHATMADTFTINVFLDATTRVKPTHIVIAGDLWDFPHFSNYSHDPRKQAEELYHGEFARNA